MDTDTSTVRAPVRGAYRRERRAQRSSPLERWRRAWKGVPRQRRQVIAQALIALLVSGLSVGVALMVVYTL